MLEMEYTIKDQVGIHARPAGLLVKHASSLSSVITIWHHGKVADAKRLFSVMALGVKCGDTITLKVEGKNEKQDFESMKNFITENL